MSARHKINSLVFCGALALAGFVGLIANSGWIFAVTAMALLAAAIASGEIRLR